MIRSREIFASFEQCQYKDHVDSFEILGIRVDATKKKPKPKAMKVKDVSKAIYDVVSEHQSQVADYNRWKGSAEVYDIPKFERSESIMNYIDMFWGRLRQRN